MGLAKDMFGGGENTLFRERKVGLAQDVPLCFLPVTPESHVNWSSQGVRSVGIGMQNMP
jgi:hypothetical protein